MKYFWTYIFPTIFGLLIYTSIRLVNDTTAGERFWERRLSLNIIEVVTVIATSYLIQAMLNYFVSRFNQQERRPINSKTILREFAIIFLCCQLIVNVTVTLMVAVTDDGLGLNDVVIVNIIPALYVLLYFAIMRGNHYLSAYVENRVKLEKITNDHLQTELKLLRAQYHPHFLFNALNTVYFQMDEDVDAAKQSIEKFSALLRYQLYDQHQTVTISREVEYLRNFIDLQQVRVSQKLHLELFIDPSLQHQQVYPLLFMPLVENAFKYVGGEYKISIALFAENGTIKLKVVNSVPDEVPADRRPGGLGLENLQRRLLLLYPDEHGLRTSRESNDFIALMWIAEKVPNLTS